MVIINDSCIGCRQCLAYCPVGAISFSAEEGRSKLDLDECVECGTCYRSEVCPVDAIEYPDLDYPRTLRRHFSDPTSRHELTRMPGRGTEEVKTNDVTNRFKVGEVGVCIEMGRPGIGTSIMDVETVTKALSKYGVTYEKKNPLVALFSNAEKGEFKDEVKGERVLSIIIEFVVPVDRVTEVLKAIKKVSCEIETVFSISLAGMIDDDGSIPVMEIAEKLGLEHKPNAKINLGLGRFLEA